MSSVQGRLVRGCGQVDMSPALRGEDITALLETSLASPKCLSPMLNRQALHLLAEGTGALEALCFEITFCIPFIVTVLHAVNQIPGIQTVRRIYQVATRSKSAKSKGSRERCRQRTAAFSRGWQNTVRLCFTTQSPQLG